MGNKKCTSRRKVAALGENNPTLFPFKHHQMKDWSLFAAFTPNTHRTGPALRVGGVDVAPCVQLRRHFTRSHIVIKRRFTGLFAALDELLNTAVRAWDRGDSWEPAGPLTGRGPGGCGEGTQGGIQLGWCCCDACTPTGIEPTSAKATR